MRFRVLFGSVSLLLMLNMTVFIGFADNNDPVINHDELKIEIHYCDSS